MKNVLILARECGIRFSQRPSRPFFALSAVRAFDRIVREGSAKIAKVGEVAVFCISDWKD